MVISFDNLKKQNIQYLFFDYNALIHPVAQKVLSENKEKYLDYIGLNLTTIIEDDIIENCIIYTNEIINNVTKGVKVYIMIDGVAPRSKMVQQRERRYKSCFFKEFLQNEKSSLWDSNKITPGTVFMKNLSNRLKKEFKNISDSDECGEGEHKMMSIIKDLNFDCNSKNKIAIYGLDADLIMLSMMNKNSDSIILIRDDSKSKTINFVNISVLKGYIYNELISTFKDCNKIINNITPTQINSFLNDYVVVIFLLGNDFLEHIPGLSIKSNGVNNVIKAYCKAWKGTHLVNINVNWKESLNLVFLKDIFYHLKRYEEYSFNKETIFKDSELIYRKDTEMQENKLLEFNNLNFYKVSIKDKMSYYKYYSINEIDSAVLDYICGMYWVFGYYNGHVHKNWNWYYTYKNSPFPSDIFNFLNNNNNQKINIKLKEIKENLPCTQIKQLCMVLPKESLFDKDILNDNDNSMLKRSIFSYQNYYPDKLYIDITNKEYMWQSKIFFKEELDECVFDIYLKTPV